MDPTLLTNSYKPPQINTQVIARNVINTYKKH